ncbi:MAG: metallophosphoesterase family protein [Nanoarchaeota archaeon]|nr:metallophosphoesterase family protein [Nanoarchaeota archaeon]
MKFLLIGDFHGKINYKLNKIKKLDFDYVLCTGDLPSDGGSRKYIFKYWKELDKKSLENIIGKRKWSEIKRKSNKSLKTVLKFLNSLSRKVYFVKGNFDLEKNTKGRKPFITHLNKKLKRTKNIKLVHARAIKTKNFTLIAHSGYRFPTEKGKEKLNFRYYTKKKIKRRNQQWNKRLKRIFSQVKDFKNSIFLVHDPPLNYLDKIINKKSPMNRKHLGDEYYLKYIKKYQPNICVCGHMHEHAQKTAKIGKTLVVNPGEASKGQFAILELKNNKYKIRFYK